MCERSIKRPVHSARVKKVFSENYRVTTLEIDHAMEEAAPGQFIMVWIPGVGEKPMSIGNRYPLTISVADVGKVSEAIGKLKAGDTISFRGPLGNPFKLPRQPQKKSKSDKLPRRILVIGGGYGVVPMYFLSKAAREEGIEVVAVIGARNGKDIIYEKQLFAVCREVYVTTDDGSRGKKGTVMAEAESLIGGKGFDCVYCCGPERMMHAVAKLCDAHSIPCQVSLERYMKCGVGVCGSCDISGRTCCKDGPVFDGADALKLADFGSVHRDACGKKA